MPRFRFTGLLLTLALGGFPCAEAVAQTAPMPSYDPLAPPTDLKQKKPPAYQTFDPNAPRTKAKETTTFQINPPASGAGKTGFDSSNSRRAASATKSKASQILDDERKTAPGTPKPAPSQSATTSDAAKKSFAAAGQPGQPPVAIGSPTPPPLRKKKKPPVDPYDPIGIHSGGMYYFPAIELIGGYDSNPGRTPNGAGAGLFTVAPELKMRSDWSSHEFKADLRGSYNWYSPDTTPSLNRPYLNGTADGRIDVTRDTRIDLSGKVLVSTDNPNSPNLQAGLATLPIFTTAGGSFGLGQKFNRLDLSVKGGFERTVYQNSELVDGTTASNDDRNFDQYAVTARAAYEMTPGVTPFVEAVVDQRVHDLERDFFGFRRDSKGVTGKVGSTFELSRLLTGELAVGWTRRNYEDPRLETLSGFIGNASLIWTASALTKVKLTAASTVGESNVVGVSGILYRDAGLEVEHAFRRWLVGTIKVGFGLDDYVGSDRLDKRYSVGAGLTYKLDRNWWLKGDIRREWLSSDVPNASYAANVFLFGVRWQY